MEVVLPYFCLIVADTEGAESSGLAKILLPALISDSVEQNDLVGGNLNRLWGPSFDGIGRVGF